MKEDIRQIVVFKLANEVYGIDIHKVHEIIMVQKITKIPRIPHFIEGVINLRGKVIPVIDLRKRLNLHCKCLDEETRIVIVEVIGNVAGMIVDGVSEVLSVPQDKIEIASPLVAGSVETEYLEGVINLGEQLIITLNIEKVLTEKQRESLGKVGNKIKKIEKKTLLEKIE